MTPTKVIRRMSDESQGWPATNTGIRGTGLSSQSGRSSVRMFNEEGCCLCRKAG